MKTTLLTLVLLSLCVIFLHAEDEIFSATDLAVLTERAGVDTIVEGVVQETGTTQEGGITFLDLDAPKKRGFTAVIFRKDYDSFALDFGSLTGKTIRVRGPIEIFRDRPQIILRSPAQLEIIEETAPAP